MVRSMLCLAVIVLAVCGSLAAADVTGGQVILRVNCGAHEDYVDQAGNTWLADRRLVPDGSWGAEGGGIVTRRNLTFEGTESPGVYLNEHYGLDRYVFRVPNGPYSVVLRFAETYPDAAHEGGRVFSVEVNGREALRDLDPFKESGGFAKPLIRVVEGVLVEDGELVVRFIPGQENPEINGIEIVAQGIGDEEAAQLAASLVPMAEGASLAPRAVDKVELETVYPWDGPAPEAKGTDDEDRPRMAVLRPDPAVATGAAVIVCPGGGYWIRAMDFEGLQVARWLSRGGITAFVLSYRVRSAGYEPDAALLDAARAVRFVRSHATDYGVDPNRIGMIGFSAGGHLITRLGLVADAGDPQAADLVEQASSRPDFLMLIYTPPAWPQGDDQEDAEEQQTGAEEQQAEEDADQEEPSGQPLPAPDAKTPPCFICHTTQDGIPMPGMLKWYEALRKAGVEAEMHVFGGYGPHGGGLATGNPGTRLWPLLASEWMRRNGFLSGKPRVEVEGVVTIDGVTMHSGWVTFIPVDFRRDPIACAMVRSSDEEGGQFQIPAKYGPVAGLHRVEVRHSAKDIITTAATMSDEALYAGASPDAEGPMTVELQPGTNRLRIDISTTPGTAGAGVQVLPAVAQEEAAPVERVVLRVNCGATKDYVDAAGNTWLADRAYPADGSSWGAAGGESIRRENLQIAGTDVPEVYLNEHWGMTRYAFPLPDGAYALRLHFAETYDGCAYVGARVFSVYVNGQPAFEELDPFKEAGGFAKPLVKRVDSVQVEGGKLTVDFAPVEQNAEINGIEIIALGPAAQAAEPAAAPAGEEEAGSAG